MVSKKCFYCNGIHTQLCDFPIGDKGTCDKPMCKKHSHAVNKMDFCRDHLPISKLANLSLHIDGCITGETGDN